MGGGANIARDVFGMELEKAGLHVTDASRCPRQEWSLEAGHAEYKKMMCRNGNVNDGHRGRKTTKSSLYPLV